MQTLNEMVAQALRDFGMVATLADAAFLTDCISVQIIKKPHESPKSLPIGKIAVYAFFYDGQALKVGKAGPNSGPRYTSHHYNTSAPSTLAKSIVCNAERIGVTGLNDGSVGAWIKANTDRVNLLLPSMVGGPMLSFLEAFLHVRWKPVFEGRS
jgi:hypothetical protein